MKKLIILVVLIFSLLSTVDYAYSYYNEETSYVVANEEGLYKLSEPVNKTQKALVPLGVVLGENETYYVTFEYTVYVEEDVDYEMYLSSIILNNEISTELPDELFNVEFTVDQVNTKPIKQALLGNSNTAVELLITATVSMNNLEDFNDYQLLWNKELDFEFTLDCTRQSTES